MKTYSEWLKMVTEGDDVCPASNQFTALVMVDDPGYNAMKRMPDMRMVHPQQCRGELRRDFSWPFPF